MMKVITIIIIPIVTVYDNNNSNNCLLRIKIHKIMMCCTKSK